MSEPTPFTNQIMTAKNHVVIGQAMPDYELVNLGIFRDEKFVPVLLTLAETDEVIAMLGRVRECAARGHDATPERESDGLRYACRCCGAAWTEET